MTAQSGHLGAMRAEPARLGQFHDPEERETVELIVALHSGGASLRAIIRELDRLGRRPQRGGRWHPQTVAKVLRREEM